MTNDSFQSVSQAIESALNEHTPRYEGSTDLTTLGEDFLGSYIANWLGGPSVGHSDRTGITRISQIGKPIIVQACRLPHIQEQLRALVPHTTPPVEGIGRKDAIMHRRFHHGHVIEAEVVTLLRAHGFQVTDTQTEVTMSEEHQVHGHCDGVLHWGGGRYVFDVKTMSDYSFREYTKKDGPHDNSGYVSQLACYHRLLGTDGAFILAYNKNTHLFRVLFLDNNRLDKRWERALNVIDTLAKVKTLADLDDIPLPDAVPELYKRQETGLYVPHPSIKYEPERLLCYELYIKKKWGKDEEYVHRKRTSINELLQTNLEQT